jgi:hypothetical protein
VIGLAAGCRSYRATLVDLVEHGERGPRTEAALEHLAVCRSCEDELTGIALTAAALRRAGETYRRLPVPEPSRPVIAAVRPVRRRWSWHVQLASLAAGAALVALVVVPYAGVPREATPSPDTQAAAQAHAPVASPWQVAEQRLALRPDPGSLAAVRTTSGSVSPRYPDTMFRPWKEVPTSDASARGFEPL